MKDLSLICFDKPFYAPVIRLDQLPARYAWRVVTTKKELNEVLANETVRGPIFFIHWSSFIPNDIWRRYECILFHMTDLPYGRGGSPLQNLIWSGRKETKISALKVVEEVDAGPIYVKQPLDISYGSALEIYLKAAQTMFGMISKIVELKLDPKPQEGETVKFTRRNPAQSEIGEEATSSPERLYDFIRMLDCPGYPKAFIKQGPAKMEFSEAKFENGKLSAKMNFVPEEEANG